MRHLLEKFGRELFDLRCDESETFPFSLFSFYSVCHPRHSILALLFKFSQRIVFLGLLLLSAFSVLGSKCLYIVIHASV
jgi:hypothetical protein